jgi:SAM-dependent methyltransferase
MERGSVARRAKNKIKNATPQQGKNIWKLALACYNLAKADKYECNLCSYAGRFWPFGDPPRRGATCGSCGSQERHRLLGLWIRANRGIVRDSEILHFAPEVPVAHLLKENAASYQSADLQPGVADLVLNIEEIDLPNESMDLIVCSHVLEHVDDAKALREVYRVLRVDGLALFMFPVVEGWDRTYENPSVVTTSDRVKHFGQFDHVRMFGRDVRDRIVGAGFSLTEFVAEEPDVGRHGLMRGERLFIATKSLPTRV